MVFVVTGVNAVNTWCGYLYSCTLILATVKISHLRVQSIQISSINSFSWTVSRLFKVFFFKSFTQLVIQTLVVSLSPLKLIVRIS